MRFEKNTSKLDLKRTTISGGYCWWKKSCTTAPPGCVDNMIFTISTGERRISEPSTVWEFHVGKYTDVPHGSEMGCWGVALHDPQSIISWTGFQGALCGEKRLPFVKVETKPRSKSTNQPTNQPNKQATNQTTNQATIEEQTTIFAIHLSFKHFLFPLRMFGEMIQFDEHIFSQMGWFNHHLEEEEQEQQQLK